MTTNTISMTVLTDTTQVVFQFHDVIRLLKPPAILEKVAGDTDFAILVGLQRQIAFGTVYSLPAAQ